MFCSLYCLITPSGNFLFKRIHLYSKTTQKIGTKKNCVHDVFNPVFHYFIFFIFFFKFHFKLDEKERYKKKMNNNKKNTSLISFKFNEQVIVSWISLSACELCAYIRLKSFVFFRIFLKLKENKIIRKSNYNKMKRWSK